MSMIVRRMLLSVVATLLAGLAPVRAQEAVPSGLDPASESAAPGPRQDPPQDQPQDQPPDPQQAPQEPLDPTVAAALAGLAESLREKREQRSAALEQGDGKQALALAREIEELEGQFNGLAAHVNFDEFEGEQQKIDLQQEVEQLIRPLLRALKEATSGPRKLAELEAKLETVKARRDQARRAADRVEAALSDLPPGGSAREEVRRQLDEYWRPLLNTLGSEILVLNADVQRQRAAQKPLLTRVTESVQGFLQESGFNLVLAALVFVGVFFGLRFVSDRILRYYRGRRGFSQRLTEVLLRVATVLVAIAATLVVPYAREDWLLQAIAIVFLIGAGWVVVKMAPQFFEQFRLILNIGSVREGERILIGGLPFRVEALRFYSRLVNPDLTGGALRVPINDLIGQRSRPIGEDEPWFPCQKGDVVALGDGVVGRVALQTPEVVVVIERHDAPRNYPTTAFLALNPRNLSRGFEIVLRFRIDYRHQHDATTTVPAALQQAVRHGLEARVEAGELHHVHVELQAAGPDALEFTVIAEFAGSVAGRYHELDRRVNALLVGACSEHGFGIPLPQLTVHRGPTTA